ncbi:MAG: putative membrane protein [Anaerolinea thermophila]|uniref:Putative membrane protein n=1 Tax=Anaerolinea thermophila TaxID=167964 RepID=A0A101FX40_9CHLR|nr:MAG: putative membrane protein [Anaerolinea thermophila]
MENKIPSYGGQAVIEGVIMRGKSSVAMAVRSPENEIITFQEKLTGIYTSKIAKIPFLRGLIVLWDSLGLGMRYLTMSANVQTGEDEKLEGPALYLTLAFSLTLGISLFFLLPAFISGLLARYASLNAWESNLIEGALRLLLLIGYLWVIGKMPEIKRVFMYHGAEHKTINAFEDGVDLTPENVVPYSLEHPRCGTSFILTLVLLSILIFSLFGPMTIYWRLISRLLLIPVLAGISYEYIHFLSKHLESPIGKVIVKPNLALQKLTTREPSLEMLDVSINAFNLMYSMENNTDTTS